MKNLNISHKDDIDQRIEQLSFLSIGKDSVYISGAITTGKDFLSWYVTSGKQIDNKEEYKQQHYNAIISKNIDTILQFATILKIKETKVIEPASLVVAEWSQPDYLYYWGQVISKYVRKIVFLDGWNYSKGCTYEYYMGLVNGLELVDQNFQPLSQDKAIKLINTSIQEYKRNAIDVKFQQTVLSEIKKNGHNDKQNTVYC